MSDEQPTTSITAEDTPISATDGIFARAYASAIKSKFQVDVGDKFQVLTSPVTQRGIAAGDLIYPEMTNFLIYKFADSLQYTDNPAYTGGSAGSYIQQLRSYIDWIQTRANPSQVVITEMNAARTGAENAELDYQNKFDSALERWLRVKDLYPNMNFWSWVHAGNYPLLITAQQNRAAATGRLISAMQAFFGPDAAALSDYVRFLANANESSRLVPGYNQTGMVDDRDLIRKATEYANGGIQPPPDDITQSLAFIPSYTIQTYSSTVQAWITAAGHGATRDQVITIDINQGRQTKWEDYGFKEVRGGGRVGFWPFFWANVYHNNTEEYRELKTEGREDSISLQLSMIGIQKFDVRPGLWDVPNIKVLFPNRLPNAPPDTLGPKFAQIVSYLVGYDVELKVTFASDMRQEVHTMFEEAKSTGGTISIFGFRISARAGAGYDEHVVTKFDDVKWDRESGTMTLTPTAGQVYPTVLAAVAQKFQ